MNIERERYGRYGIACKPRRYGAGFVAWACVGPTSATSPFDEPAKHVWFEYGETVSEAIGKLKVELAGWSNESD